MLLFEVWNFTTYNFSQVKVNFFNFTVPSQEYVVAREHYLHPN